MSAKTPRSAKEQQLRKEFFYTLERPFRRKKKHLSNKHKGRLLSHYFIFVRWLAEEHEFSGWGHFGAKQAWSYLDYRYHICNTNESTINRYDWKVIDLLWDILNKDNLPKKLTSR